MTARARAQDRLAQIEVDLASMEDQAQAAQLGVDQAANDQDRAIARYQQEIAEDGTSTVGLAATSEALLAATSQRDAIRLAIGQLKAQRLAAQALIARIDVLPAQREVDAWCADFTDDLAGEVATAEVPGEAKAVMIRPGFDGGAAWNGARDGALQPALAGTSASVFYNLAMLPGWQKWRPTYRLATITAINYELNTCSIELDAATSSAQALNVNAQRHYSSVPCQYMYCHVAVFEVGDRVLVTFDQDATAPRIIGFESNPRPCLLLSGGGSIGWPNPDINNAIDSVATASDYCSPFDGIRHDYEDSDHYPNPYQYKYFGVHDGMHYYRSTVHGPWPYTLSQEVDYPNESEGTSRTDTYSLTYGTDGDTLTGSRYGGRSFYDVSFRAPYTLNGEAKEISVVLHYESNASVSWRLVEEGERTYAISTIESWTIENTLTVNGVVFDLVNDARRTSLNPSRPRVWPETSDALGHKEEIILIQVADADFTFQYHSENRGIYIRVGFYGTTINSIEARNYGSHGDNYAAHHDLYYVAFLVAHDGSVSQVPVEDLPEDALEITIMSAG
ncbi:hypothetical protein [Modicisalibacter luteus]|uniref:Uncharacterized protein n=3 Tax=Modicisalibacter luteus TaxID=453962 RepID=A0ABV7M2Z5_9GAMM|nr:hypothetical protein [Halomonas lutea]